MEKLVYAYFSNFWCVSWSVKVSTVTGDSVNSHSVNFLDAV